jgi:hypothetical protein
MKIVLVTWGDHWEPVDDYDVEADHRLWEVQSVGFLIKQDRHCLQLVGCVDEEGKPDRPLVIARSTIKSIKVLRR